VELTPLHSRIIRSLMEHRGKFTFVSPSFHFGLLFNIPQKRVTSWSVSWIHSANISLRPRN